MENREFMFWALYALVIYEMTVTLAWFGLMLLLDFVFKSTIDSSSMFMTQFMSLFIWGMRYLRRYRKQVKNELLEVANNI